MNNSIIFLAAISLFVSACASVKNTSEKNKPRVPGLKNAEVKTIWIPDKIEGNRFEEGHYIHLIDKQTTWSAE
ncbi:MAG: hypothetical protein A4S09_03310 [Proteobacteria bacterium SG_bin7]|nr:MAG: hypothetical protein A4S09_03310 [Proteobacteria bacterium SG_bin7]